MIKIDRININGADAEGIFIQNPGGHANMIVIQCKKGYLMCGYLNMATAEKLEDVAVLVGGADFEAVLANPIKGMTPAAAALGVKEGMTGAEAAAVLNA
ncbi:MAG: DUF1805 domain-containing protein [Clostridia bacterium]|nr:DUF1805 domain-containing protein [Clostridia bacterium]